VHENQLRFICIQNKYRGIAVVARPLAFLLVLVFCLNTNISTSLAAAGQTASSHCLFTVDGSNGSTPLSLGQSKHCSFCNLWADDKNCGLPSESSFSKLQSNASFQLWLNGETTEKSSEKPANIRGPPSPYIS